MIAVIQEFFSNVEKCLSLINDKHSYIFEDNELKKGVFVSKTEPKHLHVENSTNNPIYFLHNDDCVMNNVKGGQCDYVIFNSLDFHFIDIKVAKDGFANHKKKAYKQIENTFKFYENKIDFPNNLALHGLVCFPNKKRIIKPSESTKRKEFKTKYNIDLTIGNFILFE